MRHSSFIEVHLGLLGENFNRIQSLAPKATILPMVKADAYGNGLIPVSQFLVRDCGVRVLGCATLGEAMKLNQESPALDARILVFSETELENPKARDAYLSFNISPVIHNRLDFDFFISQPEFKKLPLILKLNTGMNRLGFSMEDLEAVLPQLKDRGVEHLITHFARTAEVLKPGDKSHKQFDEFLKMKKYLRDSGVEIKETSVSNSGAIEQGFGVDETYIRPGLMLYGPSSVTQPFLWKGHQISRFVTKVLTTFEVKKGTPVGYGVNVADKDCLMAVLPVGYGDGFLTYYSGSRIMVNGLEGKVFGRVNMDMTFLQFDLSAAPKIKVNDVVEIWNHDNRVIADFATQNKTIPYQLMCAISGRIPRIYKVK
ncbi:MAG: alanine racemase [Bacteriovoracia bacterium]